MIVECGSCSARFQLDETKIKGRGARIRCRRCGTAIVVMKEEAPAPPPPKKEGEGLDLGSILRESAGSPPEGAAPEPSAAPPDRGEAGPVPAGTPYPPAAGAEAEATVPLVPGEVGPATLRMEEPRAAAPPETPEKEPSAAPPPPPAPEPPAPPAETAVPTPSTAVASFRDDDEAVDFEKIFAAAMRKTPAEAAPAGTDARPAAEEAPPAGASPEAGTAGASESSPFVMSTGESLDFLKGFREDAARPELDVSGVLRQGPQPDAAGSVAAPVRPAEPAGAPARSAPDVPAGRPEPVAPPPLRTTPAGLPSRPAPRPRPPARVPFRREHGSRLVRPSVVLVLLLFFLLAGGSAYLWLAPGGQETLRALVPWAQSLLPGVGGAETRFVIGNPIGYHEVNGTAGRIFVIRGEVTNAGKANRAGVQVRAALLGAGKQVLAERTAYGGNVLPAETLRNASRGKIDAAMSNRVGEGFSNVDIPPGRSVPFMIVFFELPEGIEEYRLDAADVE